MDVTLDLVLITSQSQEGPMTLIAIRCPHGHSEPMVQRGQTARGTQRSLCQHALWATGRLRRDSRNRGGVSAVQPQSSALRLKARGVRDTARSLPSRPTPVRSARKKKAGGLESVHTALLRTLPPAKVAVAMAHTGKAAMEERWAFVGHTGHPRWRWQAIDPHPGKVLASVFGRCQETGLVPLKAL
jgi:hypothetical protein